MTAEPDFSTLLRDSVGRSLLCPDYYFHRPEFAPGTIHPLFSLERAIFDARGRPEDVTDVHRALKALESFGRLAIRDHLVAVFADVLEGIRLAKSAQEPPVLFVGDRLFVLDSPAASLTFIKSGQIPFNLEYGVVCSPAANVLVLGTYYPFPDVYFARQFTSPITPMEALRSEGTISQIEQLLLTVEEIRGNGFRCMTALGWESRAEINVFLRVLHLMRLADRILLLVCREGMGVNIEYGMVCMDPSLAAKATVLYDRSQRLSSIFSRGTTRLPGACSVAYDGIEDLAPAVRRACRLWQGTGAARVREHRVDESTG